MILVYITSCGVNEGDWRDHEFQMRSWLNAGMAPGFQETEDPSMADVILVGNLREEYHARSLRKNEIVCRYPEKCFIVNDMDRPVPILHGIYASAEKSIFDFRRTVSSGYSICHPEWRNPFVEAFDSSMQVNECPKKYLFSFRGRNSDLIREVLFNMTFRREDVLIECSDDFNNFTKTQEGKENDWREYVEILKQSKFSLCPRGRGAASIRLFESMRLGVAPIIISDFWKLPDGPDWKKFAIIIPESKIHELERIVEERDSDYLEMGVLAKKVFNECFADRHFLLYVLNHCELIKTKQNVSERLIWRFPLLYSLIYEAERKIRYWKRSTRLKRYLRRLYTNKIM